jgi:hypothetical protein
MIDPYEPSHPARPASRRGWRGWPWVLLGGLIITAVLAVALYPAWLAAIG